MPRGTAAPDRAPLSAIYRDTGCVHYPACLSCPLPTCVYDDIRPHVRARNASRLKLLRRLMAGGLTVKEAAPYCGISIRQAYRLLQPLDKPAQTR